MNRRCISERRRCSKCRQSSHRKRVVDYRPSSSDQGNNQTNFQSLRRRRIERTCLPSRAASATGAAEIGASIKCGKGGAGGDATGEFRIPLGSVWASLQVPMVAGAKASCAFDCRFECAFAPTNRVLLAPPRPVASLV
jgi:hypothetical protein